MNNIRLTKDEVFTALNKSKRTIELMAYDFCKDNIYDFEDVKSIIYLTAYDMLSKHYKKNRGFSTNSFLTNFVRGRAFLNYKRSQSFIKMPYGKLEKGNFGQYAIDSLDAKILDDNDSNSYLEYLTYEDDNENKLDKKIFVSNLINHSGLTDLQKDVLNMYCKTGNRKELIGYVKEKYKLGQSSTYKSLEQSINKIKNRIKNKGGLLDV